MTDVRVGKRSVFFVCSLWVSLNFLWCEPWERGRCFKWWPGTTESKAVQGQVQFTGCISAGVYSHRYLSVYFMPSSSTWVNFRSASAGGVSWQGLCWVIWHEKFRMWKCLGALGPPICLFEVLQGRKRIIIFLVKCKETKHYSLYSTVAYF